MSIPSFKRLIRFVPKSDPSKVLIGEPESETIDVGAALWRREEIAAHVFSGASVLKPGSKTGGREIVERVLSPLAPEEVGTIRCIGLNYVKHAQEAKCDIPNVPTVFLKPNTSLGDPWPAKTVLPKATQETNTGDYESELAVIIGKTAKNVSEAEALDYVLGYTAANDVSSRAAQFAQTQWCYSKGFDGSCPIGPVIASKELVPNPAKLQIQGSKNDEVVQESGIDDLIFGVPKLVSFLSQGTTLPAGTVIITGTPAGVGAGKSPKVTLQDGDRFDVKISPHVGTLINVFENEA
ncbi:hypothetical protein PFICI_03911 [Pestalotiopsis fici W106-1]|uniref:Fumarylacetoacetase-like C-terminal domain-containing protein n=1 Tax=Pestalotiopsis fici (strain W106-1 / CGMCC3.15140) TaxID=1229662 RepID=W3XKX3_PESFW|nr:uncharacterized protein PFICI_03911 [Pestalotiopsis fici W106-1]ETS85886.1 hypothetical protein PFICI_03911 [Pestalotiopsis fici W106-1]